MVWRDNIKVLEMKARALPLLISMLMHMAMIGVFAFTNKEKERIFRVELMMQDMGYIHQTQIKESYRISPRPSALSEDVDSFLPREEKTELKTDSANKMETSQAIESIKPNGIMAKFTDSILTGADKGATEKSLPDARSGSDLTVKVTGHGGDVIETEFGSANAPSFVKKVMPEYPRLARRFGKEGKVVLRLFIDKHGKLLSAEVIEKAGHGFDEAAINAVKASSFQPARVNGKPVDCKAILPVSFRLQ
ncbi:energy transducer TonB [Dissulfurispira sp.]|uniref:energy transducer TonB n=1 Tax=Dissulfurispira sp. TaxID=2817609 RepID=UPI002FDB47AA